MKEKAMPQRTLSATSELAHIPADVDALLNEAQTELLLGVSARTLQAWRLRGGGPKFVKAGRAVRYRRRDLLDWIDKGTVENTSQEPAR
jgi:predicted DNA-binding transcriptional regulator AlpA